MATLPLSASRIKLCAGVPFQSDYKHSRWFTSIDSQTTFFNNRTVHQIQDHFNFQPVNKKYYVDYPLNIDEIRNVNYLCVYSGNKWFYCFVEQLEYIQRNTTRIHFIVDVLQSYRFDFSFKPSFISREHSNTTTPNTIPENINYGNAYRTVHSEHFRLYNDLKWLVIVSKSPLHEAGATTQIKASHVGSAQPLSFYVVPYLSDRYSDVANDMATPTVATVGTQQTLTPPLTLLNGLYKSQTAVNNIVSMYITEYPGLDFQVDNSGSLPAITIANNSNQRVSYVNEASEEMTMLHVDYITNFTSRTVTAISNFRNYFLAVGDSKLTVSPYRKIIIDDMKGNRIEYNPENINSSDIRLRISGGLGYNQQSAISLLDYNYDNVPFGTRVAYIDGIVNRNPQSISIVNNHLAAYMQGNKNSLQHQRENIGMNAIFSGINNTIGLTSSVATGNVLGTTGNTLSSIQGMSSVQNTIAGLEAQMKDIENRPPSIQSMGSDILYDYGNNYDGVMIYFQEIHNEYKNYLSAYFKMFGWKSNRVKIPNLTSRESFNYIKTEAVNISGTFNNEDLNTLKSIFDSGITLWHVDDVGNYNISNGLR